MTIQVLADHRSDGAPFYALVDVERETSGFRVLRSPAFLQGVAAGDLIRVDEDGSTTVLERGGNLCIQVFAPNLNPAFQEKIAKALTRIGAVQDGFGPRVLVFTAEVSTGFDVERELERVVSTEDDVEWIWGNVYDPQDGRTPLNWWK